MKTNDALDAARAAMQEAGLQCRVLPRKRGRGKTAAGIGFLEFEELPGRFPIEVRVPATGVNVGALLHQLGREQAADKTILVTDYVNPNLGKRLRDAGIQYMDTVGNAWIHQPPLHVFVQGNRPPRKTVDAQAPTGKAMQKAGLKVVLQFLKTPDLLNEPYRTIATRADVALGAVGDVIKDLQATGLVVQRLRDKERQIADFGALLDKWTEAYPLKLRQGLLLGRFVAEDRQWWQKITPQDNALLWGGEVAAQQHTGYLTPRDVTIYTTREQIPALAKAGRLRVPQGLQPNEAVVEIFERFWQPDEQEQGTGLVHPIIAYADLVATGDARNLEAADRLREELIDPIAR